MTILLLALWLWTSPAMGQSGNNNQALADCVQAANQKYKDTWEAICAKLRKEGLSPISHDRYRQWIGGHYATDIASNSQDRRATKNFPSFASKN